MTSQVFAVWTGRFQPPHEGHFAILRRSLEVLELPHIAALVTYSGWASGGEYGEAATVAYSAERNPLTIWERFWLMRLGLAGHGLLENVSVIVAPRHDLDWSYVSEFYPPKRIICLTAKDSFESAKAALWASRGERIHVFHDLDSAAVLTTTSIRRNVLGGADWRRFLPESSHEYFDEIDGPRRIFGIDR